MYKPSDDRYNRIQYNHCGNSGLRLPQMSLGLWQNFGTTANFENSKKIIEYSFDNGITHFDLANNYGPIPGSAEENFGRILREDLKGYRDELIISTKAGYIMWDGPYGDWGSKKYLVASLNQSLKRLGVDYVDVFYHHRPDPNTPLEEIAHTLELLVQQGKCLYVGISNYKALETIKLTEMLRKNNVPIIIHQPRFNLLDRWIEPELVDALNKEQLGCIAFSPLAQGLLSGKYSLDSIPGNSRKANTFTMNKIFTEENLKKVDKLKLLAQNRGQTLAQFSLSWILSHKFITSVLVGASSVEQLKENIQALNHTSFTKEELELIDNITL